MVFSSLVSFYIPLVLILFAYGRVFLIATRHSKSRIRGEKHVNNEFYIIIKSILFLRRLIGTCQFSLTT